MTINNNSGKVFTIFLIIIAILLISLTAISMFFFMEEVKLRESVEDQLAKARTEEVALKQSLDEITKKLSLEAEKNKEAEEKINSLMDDLELEEGVKEEIRGENQSLRDELKIAKEAQSKIREQVNGEVDMLKKRIAELEQNLIKEKNRNLELENTNIELKNQVDEGSSSRRSGSKSARKDGIQLKKIVVTEDSLQGRILSIDIENDFMIFNRGQKDGVQKGMTVTISRSGKYIGEGTVTRVQAEMSAVDFMPPLSGRKVRKNDQVILNQ